MLTRSGAPDQGRLFAGIDFQSSPSVIAAVSGGSDSTALLVLLHEHLTAISPDTKLVAVTVDHQLRAESACEAAEVATLAARLGIRHATLRWSGDKPTTGLPAAARAARYGLLLEAARAEGATIVLTGHTADDQAETVLMRQARGTGRGLAGMAPAVLLDGRVWMLRPLLGIRRAALRAMLRKRGIGWIEDPSNIDPDYERVRVRAELAGSGRFEEAMRTARAAAQARRELGLGAAALIDAHASLPSPGLVRLAPAFVAAADRSAAVYALRILLAVVGGQDYLPEAERAADLLDRAGRPPARATLSSTVLDARASGIFLRREVRGLPTRDMVKPGAVWDGRFVLGAAVEGLEVAPLGGQAAVSMAAEIEGVPAALARAALATEPALWRAGDLIGLAPAKRRLAPWAGLLPSFDLAPAAAVARGFGAESPPALPYVGQTAETA